ncbi:MAG: response regulator, partial [Chloroflexi bacterium]|nr:response regulator [Chloroflexota bacterium]
DKLELIFEEFAQADPALHSRGGAGLGLALSRQFVKLHGGAMWVQSVLGQGSSFYFSLPLPGVAQGALLKRLPDRRRFDMEAAPILVVDPDPSIPEMLSRYLGDHPIIGLTEPGHIPELVEKEHPLAIIENLPPDAPDEKWLGPPDLISARYGVPFFRCSIPSPSWLRQASGFDDLLTKPLARAALDRILDKYGQAEGSRLLVVDDDPGFVRLLSRMLEKDPRVAHLFVAYGGEHALRLARAQRPDLILLDLLMPNIDGFQVLQALRSEPHTSQITIVAVTATSYAEEALLRHGSRFVLTQSNELSTGTVVDLLSAALKLVEPHYVQRDEPATASSM